MSSLNSLELAGVPVLIRPPTNTDRPALLIILWHGFGPPESEKVLAETLALESVEAWKVYVGLPLFGQRLPEGGTDELMPRQIDDYVLRLLLPIVEQATHKLPDVVKALQERFSIDLNKGIGLFGFSAGGFTALLALLESKIPIAAAVLVGITKNLDTAVNSYERIVQETYSFLKEQYPWVEEKHKKYSWSEKSEAAKQRLDFIVRAEEITKRNPLPATLFVHGMQDEIYEVSDTEKLYAALLSKYEQFNQSERLSMQTFRYLAHHIKPVATDISPEQRQDIATLQETVANWFSKYLTV
ncbi:MAG: prolyl oligopeptidase family serine peptidase [Nostoc sp.]|uniref:alpha/beta hydrolase family protein n=1 Tax=Nostoc sp. TaxID=1180 RepID=UPI002FFB3744